MTISDRTATQEIGKRVGEAGAGLAAAAHALALAHHARDQRDYARRLADSHAAGNIALGLKPSEGEAMPNGDITINVTGDIYGKTTQTAPGVPPAAGPSAGPPADPAANAGAVPVVPAAKPIGTAAKLATAAALLAGGAGAGAGIPWLLGAFEKNPPAATAPATPADLWQLEITVPEANK